MYVEDMLSAIRGQDVEVRNDDDTIDRLSYRWTVVVLVIFAALVTAETYLLEDRINCWVPAHFKGAWEDYTNDYCWVRNTYYLPWEADIPRDLDSRERFPIVYYQWVPLFMLIQALLFYFPILLWRTFNHRTGIDVNDIVETAERVQKNEDEEIRVKLLNFLTRQMDRYLGISKKPLKDDAALFNNGRLNCRWVSTHCCFCCFGGRLGNYMSVLYIFTKIFFLANAIGQLFVLNWFLGEEFNMYGIKLVHSWFGGPPVDDSPYFPKVTLCDLQVRRVGNVHRYSVQCVLPINMFNEKIYMFIWFWFLFVAVMTAYSLIVWSLRLFLPKDAERYIIKRLVAYTPKELFDPTLEVDRERAKLFVRKYLRSDGVLVCRLVDYNTNKVTAEDLMTSLWSFYLLKKYGHMMELPPAVEPPPNPEKPPIPEDDVNTGLLAAPSAPGAGV